MKAILKLTIFIMAVGLLWATGAFAQQVNPLRNCRGSASDRVHPGGHRKIPMSVLNPLYPPAAAGRHAHRQRHQNDRAQQRHRADAGRHLFLGRPV